MTIYDYSDHLENAQRCREDAVECMAKGDFLFAHRYRTLAAMWETCGDSLWEANNAAHDVAVYYDSTLRLNRE